MGKIQGKKILITGAAGFIGSKLALKILEQGDSVQVVGVDNINDYYDVNLKYSRLEEIKSSVEQYKNDNKWIFIKADISDKEFLLKIFEEYGFDVVVNLAAQAGVRYSLQNPDTYIQANIIGFYNILEACRKFDVQHLVFASSSSVYGKNKKIPYSEYDMTDQPVSLYAATKKSDELLAYSYAELYKIPMTGLRFFTVYGPKGRPDMAYFSFADKLANGETIDIYNFGNCKRDFTYIDDVVESIIKVCTQNIRKTDTSFFEVYNIGNHSPVNLMEFVTILSEELIKVGVLDSDFRIEKKTNLIEMQKGDVPITYADMEKFKNKFDYSPKTSIRDGLHEFAKWYYEYCGKKKT